MGRSDPVEPVIEPVPDELEAVDRAGPTKTFWPRLLEKMSRQSTPVSTVQVAIALLISAPMMLPIATSHQCSTISRSTS
jgi:hypothetical protein